MAHADINSTDRRIRWRARNADKDQAHRAVESFVRSLRRRNISKPNCASCDRTEEDAKATGHEIDAHHTDYSRPLDVVWLCDTCHIVDHWNSTWRGERAGRPVTFITSTTVVEKE